LNAIATAPIASHHKALSRRQAVGVVFLCTVIAAVSQMLIKLGAKGSAVAIPWTSVAGVWANVFAMATNVHLVGGYALYAVMTVMFIVALQDEELSILYPIISLSYVWVAGLSIWLFGETLNVFKSLGVLVIVAGVAVLGKDGK
jgi:multidrug transporter EmrE-like cation transporter